MKFTYKFDKILALREREKEEAVFTYEAAVRKFEEVGEKLYQLLKKKEELELDQQNKIVAGLSIQELRIQQNYLINLQKEIHYYQQMVSRARQNMLYEEQRLQERNIEVKKLEKLKIKDYEKYLQLENQEEGKVMDELAMQSVARRN
ncbi:flagellar export protein FliJ [Caldibacillus lycopersici]|uniref:Flagellar FliJ protein n=1 Tax=Perspicuibacillus lycopersici TaxID=1325689 RepID=A0AAE3LRU6_9BACI|nr:flagellar export protein FliJ [Perspicuibacillus lycopersici]MCU9612103.1 flagellar export protein FliJ [Perspicuibacillus lycopersici]